MEVERCREYSRNIKYDWVLPVGNKGNEMQRAVILGRKTGVKQKRLRYQVMEMEFCSTVTFASEQGEVIVSRYTKGRKDSYQTSQCKCLAVRLMLQLSQVHLTPWLFSRCQKTRDILDIRQTIFIIMQVGDVCTQQWSLSSVMPQGTKETRRESYQTGVPVNSLLSY